MLELFKIFRLEAVVIIVTVLVVCLPLLIPSKPPGREGGPGWLNLSLPLALSGRENILEGWSDLPVVIAPETQEPVAVDTRSQDAAGKACRIRLSGVVERDESRMYLLFDTLNSRWFRLSNGQTDEVSSVVLENTDSGEVLIDLRVECRYRVDPVAMDLSPIQPGQPKPE